MKINPAETSQLRSIVQTGSPHPLAHASVPLHGDGGCRPMKRNGFHATSAGLIQQGVYILILPQTLEGHNYLLKWCKTT